MDAAAISSVELEPGREPLLETNMNEEGCPNGAAPEVGNFNFQNMTKSAAETNISERTTDGADARMYDLIGAADTGRVHKVHSLLAQGVDPNAHDYDLRYALHLACAGGHLEVVKVLTEAKANVDVVDRFGHCPLDEAMRNQHTEVSAYLTSQGAASSLKFQNDLRLEVLQLAAGQCTKEKPMNPQQIRDQVEKLITLNNVNVNCVDYHKRTPLHLAVAENNVEMARLLLKLGADPTKEDRWKGTPISEASRHANRTGANELTALFPETETGHSSLSMFSVMFVLVEILLIVLMFSCTKYGDSAGGGDEAHAKALDEDPMSLYSYFQDVNVMIFIGFGYLMTFLRNNAYSSLGLTFLVACVVIQWHFLVGGFFHQVFCTLREGAHSDHCHWHAIPLDLTSMVTADFAAGAVLITYGALLGKVSPMQLCSLALLEIVFFAINENIGLVMGITDIGGSMVVHMFGAYFGMGASLVLRQTPGTHDKNAAVYHSDMLAMIGTVFLWMFWPSFNGALGSGVQQHRVVLNTFISLAGSCVAAFLASYIIRGHRKFDMVDIQNASLAGGVAMGTAADMILGPGAALLVGVVAGAVSVIGYVYIQPLLENKLGFHDTCGVNNLHGIPSIIGAVAGAIASTQATPALYGALQLGTTFSSVADGSRTASEQAGQQAKFALITFASSLATGMLSALLVKYLFSADGPTEAHELFTDENFWVVPHLEEPYYFDRRGEIQRDPTESDEVNRMSELEAKVAQLEKALNSIKDSAAMPNPATSTMSSVEELFGRLLQKITPEKRD